jgi:hypothetical protein
MTNPAGVNLKNAVIFAGDGARRSSRVLVFAKSAVLEPCRLPSLCALSLYMSLICLYTCL